MPTALITGTAGFIGFFAAKRLLDEGYKVVGVDCMSDYYDLCLKQKRLKILQEYHRYVHIEDYIEAKNLLGSLFAAERPDVVIHLAAQAGVRYSIENPRAYLESNIIGTFELLEAARSYPPRHTLIASTSSAYGANSDMPYKETQRTDHQLSFYAATKKSTEHMAHSYAHLFSFPVTIFRFFTVYGPWGRPDMAPYKFTKAILAGEAIDLFNYGNMRRDFTYIEDLVEAIYLLINNPPTHHPRVEEIKGDSLSPVAPYRVVNIGNSNSVTLNEFIEAIECATGRIAIRNLMAMQPGDVPDTWADASLLYNLTGYKPATDIRYGVDKFVTWFRTYYKL